MQQRLASACCLLPGGLVAVLWAVACYGLTCWPTEGVVLLAGWLALDFGSMELGIMTNCHPHLHEHKKCAQHIYVMLSVTDSLSRM